MTVTAAKSVPSAPLSMLLATTARAVGAVRKGQSTTAVLAAVDLAQRPAVQALLFQVLRNEGRAVALRCVLAPRVPPPQVDALLCCALALLWNPLQAPYTPFTLVNQAVEAARSDSATRAQAGFINACLRRFLRDCKALVKATDCDDVALYNYPAWWIARVRHDYPDVWQQILQAGNISPPMTLRVARIKSNPVQYCQLLAAMNIAARPIGADGVVLAHPMLVTQLPGFAEGMVSVQDAAAQWAAPLLLHGLDRAQPLCVLDACAAPGGKTAHLLDYAKAQGKACQVTALEIDATRAARIHDTLRRLDVQAKVCVGDATVPTTWWDGQLFDAILLDVPCTASGIVRRHPDVRWLRRESDIAQLAIIQARLLAALWPLLKIGGRMLYCTCSIFRSEGQEQVQTFLAHNTDARLLPSPGHVLPSSVSLGDVGTDNGAGEHDGFFYALLSKTLEGI